MKKIYSNYRKKEFVALSADLLPTAKKRHLTGFTLIELMVVISIIGVLATLIAVNLTRAQAASRDTKRKSDLSMIMSAIVMYGSDNGGVLPVSDGYIEKTSDHGGSLDAPLVAGGYLDEMPNDPKQPLSIAYTGYVYFRSDYGASYIPAEEAKGNRKGYLYASLEKSTGDDDETMANYPDDSNMRKLTANGRYINFRLSN